MQATLPREDGSNKLASFSWDRGAAPLVMSAGRSGAPAKLSVCRRLPPRRRGRDSASLPRPTREFLPPQDITLSSLPSSRGRALLILSRRRHNINRYKVSASQTAAGPEMGSRRRGTRPSYAMGGGPRPGGNERNVGSGRRYQGAAVSL